jgi:hypothetical protein
MHTYQTLFVLSRLSSFEQNQQLPLMLQMKKEIGV